ncbi:MAG: hypothetical protein U0935_20890 [Pirellulales bacterium]
MKALKSLWTKVVEQWKQASGMAAKEWQIVVLSATDGGKTALYETLRTPHAASRLHVVWATPRNDAGDMPLAASRELNVADGHAPCRNLWLADPPGEWFSAGPQAADAQPLAERVEAAHELLLLVPPSLLFGSDVERERLLATFVRWVVFAVQSPRRGQRPLKVSVVFTKADQYGETGAQTRLLTSSRSRSMLRELGGTDIDATWSLWVRTLAAESCSPELVKDLLHRTRPLFCGLADALRLSNGSIDAYLTAARPVEPVREPWGVDVILADSVDFAEHTGGRPRIHAAWPASALALSLAVLGWGLYEGRQAFEVSAFQRMLQEKQFARGEEADLRRWVPSTTALAEQQLDDAPAWLPDPLAESLLARRLESLFDDAQRACQATADAAQLQTELEQLIQQLDEVGRWDRELTDRERVVLRGSRQKMFERAIARTRERLKKLHQVAQLAAVETPDWDALTAAVEQLERSLAEYQYLNREGDAVSARTACRPWLSQLLGSLAQGEPAAYRRFLRTAPDHRCVILEGLGLPVNPYRQPPSRLSLAAHPVLPQPGERNCLLSLRDAAGRQIDLDFYLGSTVQVAGPAGASSFDYTSAIVVSVQARQQYDEAMQAVQLTCRGQQELNLASVVEGLQHGDAALQVRCADPQLARLVTRTLLDAFAQAPPPADWFCEAHFAGPAAFIP